MQILDILSCALLFLAEDIPGGLIAISSTEALEVVSSTLGDPPPVGQQTGITKGTF